MTFATMSLKHIAINKTLSFPVIITSFEQQTKPNWSSTQVYGRMDPIFTYQNTVRTFTAILRTPKKGQVVTEAQRDVLVAGGFASKSVPKAGDAYKCDVAPGDWLNKVADLYKMMYPVYEPVAGNRSTGFMVASPLLTLQLEGVAYNGMGNYSSLGDGLLFVPETFTISNLVDSEKASITVNSAADLRFFANAEGYQITLGGTILHQTSRAGFEVHGNTAYFGQGANFPYNTNSDSIFGDLGAHQRAAAAELIEGLEACLDRVNIMSDAQYIACVARATAPETDDSATAAILGSED